MTDQATPLRLGANESVVGTARGLHMPSGANALDGREITAVHVAGRDVWVLAEHRHLYRARQGSFDLVASLDEAAGTCVITHRERVWVGGADAGLWRLDRDRFDVVESFLDAPSRPEWHTPWGGPPAIFSMASDGTDLYVGVHVGGILRSPDDGRTWTPTIDLHDDVHQVAVDDRGVVWAATGRRALARSTDRGETWQYHSDGLHAHYLLAVAATSDGVLVGASSGHAGRDGALYRFSGDGFARCRAGLPDDLGGAVSPRHLVAAGDEAVVALPDGDVYASGDAGRSWARIASDLPGISEVVLRPRQ